MQKYSAFGGEGTNSKFFWEKISRIPLRIVHAHRTAGMPITNRSVVEVSASHSLHSLLEFVCLYAGKPVSSHIIMVC